MLKCLKVIHVLGVVLFLGSVFAHIAAGQIPVTPGSSAILTARQVIDLTTRYVTLPGLGIAIVSGALMAAKGYSGALKRRWLMLHMAAALAVAVISVTVMAPAGREILAAAGALAAGNLSPEALSAIALREHVFGAVNILLAIAAIVLGVVKPRLSRRQS